MTNGNGSANRPTGTVTMLFGSVEGSTEMAQSLGQDYDAVAGKVGAALSECFRRFDGYEMPTEGDSYFAVFGSARNAVDAAVCAQRAVAALNPFPGGVEATVGMGLHTGEVRVVDGDYRGIDVHRAARVAAVAHGGQVLVTEPTRALAQSGTGEELSFVDLGEHSLKDLEHPERLYQVAAPGLKDEFPPVLSLATSPSNLPVPQSSFIPRERELRGIEQMIRQHRLVTLTGPGGTGKTRLALQVTANLQERFSDGVFAVFLARLADPELVPSTVAQALGVRQQGLVPIWETVKEFLAHKHMLLLFDNFEHLLAAAPYVNDLLSSTSDLRILVTSRAALRITAEHEYPVPPMTLPDPDELSDLRALGQSEAVELFVQRARLVKPEFTLTDANASAVAQICLKVDGLPLAIELAAARIRLLEPEELARRLENSLALLTGGPRDLPARQQTLRNTIKWSYDLLDESERELFRRLGVFAGGFSLEAVEALAGGEVDVLDELQHLVEQSLLKAEFTDHGTRYWALEPVRQFAGELLEQSPNGEAFYEAHAGFFAQLALKAEALLQGPSQLEWLSRLDAENDNLRAAMSWALNRNRHDLIAALGRGLWMFWWLHGHQEEGRRFMESALQTDPPTLPRAVELAIAGAMALVQGDHRASIAYLHQSIALARELQNYELLAFGLHTLGLAALNEPDLETAESSFLEALPIFTAGGNDLMVSGLRTHLGTVALIKGDLDGAEESMTEALRIARKLGDNVSTYFALYNLAQVALSRADFDKAAPLLSEGLALAGQVQDQTNLAYYLEGWAVVLGARGEGERSARLMGASQQLREAAEVATYNYLTPSRPLYEQTVAAVRKQIGDEAFDRATAEGRAMSLSEAVAYALQGAPAEQPATQARETAGQP
ncbi:MAG TPA: tetratricopeptide repeat protein [Actinomycetota bacterium]|nr:tetratricopeptide repeat protein [Actinomycetota bacterium]